MKEFPLSIGRKRVGDNFLVRNSYGQHLHFGLVRIHVAGDGLRYYYLRRIDLGQGEKAANCYSEGDLAEFVEIG